jgi:hypothetical protein
MQMVPVMVRSAVQVSGRRITIRRAGFTSIGKRACCLTARRSQIAETLPGQLHATELSGYLWANGAARYRGH